MHLGHIEALKYIFGREGKSGEIIIGIGSTQHSHSLKNPFTAGERLLMLRRALLEYGFPLERVYVVTIPDIERNALWVSHVESYCPPFSRVYSNNSLVRRLFKERKYEVLGIPLINRKEFQGTVIRNLMLHGGSWERYVPKSVLDVIEAIHGLERIRELQETDY